jgi:stage III sporulation protein AF
MDWLGGWLKSVITVILLATFVDLLLPSSTMQRYVKTVMSLFILLTLLSPVLELFQKNFSVERLLSAAEQKQSAVPSGGGNARMKSLEAIEQEAERLKAVGQKQSQQLIQTQLAQLLKEDLQKQTDLQVSTVQLSVNLDNNGKPSISDVRVTLDEIDKKEEPKRAPDKSIAAMEPVRPIERIQISSQAAADKGKASKLSPELEQELSRLKQGISRDWQVDSAHIDIRLQNSKDKL